MDYVEFSGKTVEDALTEALVSLGLTSDQIEYEVIEKGGGGLFSFKKQAKIRVRKKEQPVEETKEAETATEPEVVSTDSEIKAEEAAVENAPAEDIQEESGQEDVPEVDVKESAQDFLSKVFKAMNMEVNVIFHDSDEENVLNIELAGDDMGVLIGKRGQTLDALQYLTGLAVNKHSSHYTRIKMDAEDYRSRRQKTLENLAKNLAYKVKKTNRAAKLEPMNPFERRVIHCALQEDRYVETHSEGEEPYRYVVITPKR